MVSILLPVVTDLGSNACVGQIRGHHDIHLGVSAIPRAINTTLTVQGAPESEGTQTQAEQEVERGRALTTS